MKLPKLEYLDKRRDACEVPNCSGASIKTYRRVFLCSLHAQQILNGTLDSSILDSLGPRCYIYVLASSQVKLLKFGRSREPLHRFRQIRDGSPVDVDFVGYCLDPQNGTTEGDIHKYLAKYRVNGEWFTDCEETRQIAKLIQEGDADSIIKACKSLK